MSSVADVPQSLDLTVRTKYFITPMPEVRAAWGNDYEAYGKFQHQVTQRVMDLAAELADAAQHIWSVGDGYGGAVQQYITEAFERAGLQHTEPRVPTEGPGANKDKISARLRTAVYGPRA